MWGILSAEGPLHANVSATADAATWNYCAVPHYAVLGMPREIIAMVGELAGLLIRSARHLQHHVIRHSK